MHTKGLLKVFKIKHFTHSSSELFFLASNVLNLIDDQTCIKISKEHNPALNCTFYFKTAKSDFGVPINNTDMTSY